MTAGIIVALVVLSVAAGMFGARLLIRAWQRQSAVGRPPLPVDLRVRRPAPRPAATILRTRLDGLRPTELVDLAKEATTAGTHLMLYHCQCTRCLPVAKAQAVELRRFAKECRRRADLPVTTA